MRSAFEELLQEAQQDGYLIDLYVLRTDIGDWQRLLDCLRQSQYVLSYDGNPAHPPDAREIFGRSIEDPTHTLSIDVAGLQIDCHFFTEEEIEFDVGPREIEAPAQIDALFRFMEHIGRALKKDVILTPENLQSAVVVRFDHEADRIVAS